VNCVTDGELTQATKKDERSKELKPEQQPVARGALRERRRAKAIPAEQLSFLNFGIISANVADKSREETVKERLL
jgi:hypothetical protein